MPTDLTPAELDAIEARRKAAHCVVNELCDGHRTWTMSVPARCEHDPDLVIDAALRDNETLTRALRAAWEENEKLRTALRECSVLFWEIRGEFPDPRSDCREGMDIVSRALTPPGEGATDG